MTAEHTVLVELDAETIRRLAAFGEPAEVLAHLARSVADGARNPARAQRDRTDTSLQAERNKVDDCLDADATPGREGAARRTDQHESLEVKRDATDLGLTGERAQADTVLVDQREANEQLVLATLRAQELAEEADTAKGQAETSARDLRAVAEFREMFIGILGHDLRNPLAAILMFAGLLLRRGHLGEPDVTTVSQIIRATQRMARMITQLLDLTRARLGGGLPIEVGPTDLREVCQNVADEFGSTVRLELAGDLNGVWDADRLAETLSNLVGNAIEHATADTAVTVGATDEGDEIVVTVRNHGEPIPAEILPFIFEPFRRGRPREKSPTHNLGLGLYIAQQIVRSHGGTLSAHSLPGMTTFAVRLPRSSPSV